MAVGIANRLPCRLSVPLWDWKPLLRRFGRNQLSYDCGESAVGIPATVGVIIYPRRCGISVSCRRGRFVGAGTLSQPAASAVDRRSVAAGAEAKALTPPEAAAATPRRSEGGGRIDAEPTPLRRQTTELRSCRWLWLG